MVEPDAPRILGLAAQKCGGEFDADAAVFIVAQEIILTCQRGQLPRWQRMLFGFLSRNVMPGPDYLEIPPGRLVVFNWMLHLEHFSKRLGCGGAS